jgi:hypothetical protein
MGTGVSNMANLPANERKSSTRFCGQVAAWVPDMFYNFYLMKISKIAKNSATTKAR